MEHPPGLVTVPELQRALDTVLDSAPAPARERFALALMAGERVTPHDPMPYDPSAVPEWARERIAYIAREHPQYLACHLDHVAEIEAAKRYAAGHPPPSMEPRDLLHLSAIQAWQALAKGEAAPDLDPDLEQVIYDAFVTSDGRCRVDQLCEGWLDLARQCGIAVNDQDGDLLPGVLEAISHTVSAAIWFGLTTGYLTLAGCYHIPRELLPC